MKSRPFTEPLTAHCRSDLDQTVFNQRVNILQQYIQKDLAQGDLRQAFETLLRLVQLEQENIGLLSTKLSQPIDTLGIYRKLEFWDYDLLRKLHFRLYGYDQHSQFDKLYLHSLHRHSPQFGLDPKTLLVDTSTHPALWQLLKGHFKENSRQWVESELNIASVNKEDLRSWVLPLLQWNPLLFYSAHLTPFCLMISHAEELDLPGLFQR